MAKKNLNFEDLPFPPEEGPDLSPGFFSSYGYEGGGALIIHEPETGRKYRWRDGKKVYEA